MCSGRFPGDWRKKPGGLCRTAFQPETRPAEKAAQSREPARKRRDSASLFGKRKGPLFSKAPEGFCPRFRGGKARTRFHEKGEKNMEFSKDTRIGEILEKAPEKAEILLNSGMHCIGCPASQMETLEEACEVHGIDVEDLVEKLNA